MLLGRLRQETKQLHRRIESSLNLLRTDFSLNDYRWLLERFYGYYCPWEARAEAIAPNLIAERRKRDRLARDLVHLGLSRAELAHIERCDRLPPLDTLARLVGSMYVTEGSTLGGQALQRSFRTRFGFEIGGCEFFSGYGERTGKMWMEFGQILEARPPREHEEIISSAIATFVSIGQWAAVPCL